MSAKAIAAKQYQALADRAAKSLAALPERPPEGWMATLRKALGMSAAEVARRLGVTRARIVQAEQRELAGGVTLRTLQTTAEAMGCRFVYALVPREGSVEAAITAQAYRKAEALVARAGLHMALERQSLSEEANRAEVERLAEDLRRTRPADFWSDR